MRGIFNEGLAVAAKAVDAYPWQDKAAYANMVAQTYYYVGHSTRLLAVAASRFTVEEEFLHRRFAAHMAEEKSHHLLALHDLKALGGTLEQYPELAITSAFYESQYYKCGYQDPVSLFGYILALEGLAVASGKKLYETVRETYGAKATTFLKVHAEDDVEHLDTAFEYLNALPEPRQRLVLKNFVQSCTMYGLMLSECARK